MLPAADAEETGSRIARVGAVGRWYLGCRWQPRTGRRFVSGTTRNDAMRAHRVDSENGGPAEGRTMNASKIVAVVALIVCATSVAGCGGDVQLTDAGTSDAGPSADASTSEAGAPTAMGIRDAAPPTAMGIRDATPQTDAVDSGCGTPGTPCCGTSCNAGDVCVAIGGVAQCQACGEPGQPCCATMPACADTADSCFYQGSLMYCMNDSPGTLGQAGDGCTTTCADPGDTCLSNGMSSYCIACGGLGNPCCGTSCGPSLRCMAGTCR